MTQDTKHHSSKNQLHAHQIAYMPAGLQNLKIRAILIYLQPKFVVQLHKSWMSQVQTGQYFSMKFVLLVS